MYKKLPMQLHKNKVVTTETTEGKKLLKVLDWKYMYGSTFNVGMGQVQNGRLYLRYERGYMYVVTTAKRDKNAYRQ